MSGLGGIEIVILLGFMFLPLVLALTAIGTGVVARREIERSRGTLGGGGAALAGIICGALALCVAAVFTVMGLAAVAGISRTTSRAWTVQAAPAITVAPPMPVPIAPQTPVLDDPFAAEDDPFAGEDEDG